MDKQEAIKILKEFHNTSALFSVRTALETVFPELKEDEDELEWLKQFIQEEAYILSMDIRDDEDSFRLKKLQRSLEWLEKQGDKDKLIQKLGEYKVKYTQEVLEKHVNNMSNKDDERLRKTTISFLKDFAKQGYENAVECIDWLEKQGEQKPIEWKDSDEKYLFWALLSIQKDIAASEINGVNTKDLNDCVKWLYSLKQRIKEE